MQYSHTRDRKFENGLESDLKLKKKFQGMEFRDFYELFVKVIEYEELLKKESNRKKTSMGTYYQEANFG